MFFFSPLSLSRKYQPLFTTFIKYGFFSIDHSLEHTSLHEAIYPIDVAKLPPPLLLLTLLWNGGNTLTTTHFAHGFLLFGLYIKCVAWS